MHRRILQHDSDIGLRFIPGLKARIDHEAGGYLVRVNGEGFRSDHEFRSARPPGTFRVLLFGDSATAGQGVSNGRRYSDCLEDLVPGIEVYNFAINGSGPDQQYLVYRQLPQDFEYDLVVISIWLENIRRVAARQRLWRQQRGLGEKPLIVPKPYFTLRDEALELGNVPVPKPFSPDELSESEKQYVDWAVISPPAWRQAASRLKLRAAVNLVAPQHPLPEYDRPDHPSWRLMRAVLQQWTSEVRTPALLCLLPPPAYVEEHAAVEGYRARFAELEDPPRVLVHDVLESFLAHPKEERRRFRFGVDIHPSEAGHQAIAASLAPRIRAYMNER